MNRLCARYLKWIWPLLFFTFSIWMILTMFHEDDLEYHQTREKRRSPGEVNVYRWKTWRWTKIPGFCSREASFQSAKLHSPIGSVKMYVHSPLDDNQVSAFIISNGTWDKEGVNLMVSHLKQDEGMGVLDIGSHIGVFTVVAALMGRQVIAVDPLVENVLRLCKTVQENNMADRVTILFTALSDSHKTVSFKRRKGNIGNTFVKREGQYVKIDKDDYNPKFTNTATLDDVLNFVNFSSVFIKMDVENHELQVLKSGSRFLETKNIRAILMEWFQATLSLNSDHIINIMTAHKFKAVNPVNNVPLPPKSFLTWPHDIVWVKQ